MKQLFKTEESRFIMWVGLKVSLISLAVTAFIYYILFLFVRLNYAFFRAQGFSVSGEDMTFYELVSTEAIDTIPIIFAFHIFLFFIGTYVGWLLLRPFREIGDYCERVLENPNQVYKVEEFSNYRLLTRFSELFFEYLREARESRDLKPHSIAPQYSKIHKPVLDWVFLLHFGLLLVIICICTGLFLAENLSSIYETMIQLGTTTLKDSRALSRFFSRQTFVISDLITMSVVLLSFFYLLLGLHLYEKVSGAAFGIFSTMRAFMKGNHISRVHLVGFAYVRDHTRKLNKYLEYIENNLNKPKH